MSRRCVEREYAEKECDEVCQDVLARDRFELRERSRTTDRCSCRETEDTTRCPRNCDDWDNDNSNLSRENRNRRGLLITNRTSGQECSTDDVDDCEWDDPCRCRCNWDRCGCERNWNRCGCDWNRCGCERNWNRCGCDNCSTRRSRRSGCGCTRGLNCDRNRRLRSCCPCDCKCKEDCE